MFDMGFTEMMLIGVVALVVIGPERLPGAARTAGKYFGKLKRFVTNVRADVESELRADELREIVAKQQEQLDSLKDAVSDVSKEANNTFSSWEEVIADAERRNSTLDQPADESPSPEAADAKASENSALDNTAAEESDADSDSDNKTKTKADEGP